MLKTTDIKVLETPNMFTCTYNEFTRRYVGFSVSDAIQSFIGEYQWFIDNGLNPQEDKNNHHHITRFKHIAKEIDFPIKSKLNKELWDMCNSFVKLTGLIPDGDYIICAIYDKISIDAQKIYKQVKLFKKLSIIK